MAESKSGQYHTGDQMSWRALAVYSADGYLGQLGDLVDNATADLDTCEITAEGQIMWPDHMIAAPGEDPDWDTPRVSVDWTGFDEALDVAHID